VSCDIPYIIENLLELKCLKWARIAYLDILNTSYGQKKGRESNWQFDFRPQKVGNRPDLLVCKGLVTYLGNLLTRAATLLQITFQSKVCLQSYGAPNSQESQLRRFRGSPGKKSHLDVGFVASHRVYYKAEGGGFPQV
jgi:hypothetical protein